MNRLLLLALVLLGALSSSCGKKSTPAPTATAHVIKIKASATGKYEAGVSIKKKDQDAKTNVDVKAMSSGESYEYTTTAVTAGDQVFISFYNPDLLAVTKVSYVITDNGTQIFKEDDKALSSTSIQFIVK